MTTSDEPPGTGATSGSGATRLGSAPRTGDGSGPVSTATPRTVPVPLVGRTHTGGAPTGGAPAGSMATSRLARVSARTQTSHRPVLQDPTITSPATPAADREAVSACCRAVLAAYEVLQGHRSVQHLATLVTADVLGAIERRLMIAGTDPQTERQVVEHRVRVTRVRPWVVSAVAAELTVVVTVGGRTRAVAARVELRRDRWRVTELVLG